MPTGKRESAEAQPVRALLDTNVLIIGAVIVIALAAILFTGFRKKRAAR